MNDDRRAKATHHAAAHEADIRQIKRLAESSIPGRPGFLGGHGLAGRGRLIDEQIFGAEKPQIGRNHIARRKPHDVARNEPFYWDVDEPIGLDGNDGPLPRTAGVRIPAQSENRWALTGAS
jgi:hypothetical protein